jgi:hypothetical protein
VVSDAQQHLFSKFLVMDDKGGEEKTIKAYLFVVVKPVSPVLQTSLTGLC